MPQDAPFYQELANLVPVFMIILTRLSPIVFFLPGIGEEVIPVRVRLMLLLALSASVAGVGLVEAPQTSSAAGFAGVLISEALVGICLGVSLRLVSWVLSAAGAVIAQSIGLAQFLGVALQSEAQTITANFLTMAGAAVLVTADFHIAVLKALFKLYEDLPAGQVPLLDETFFIQNIFAGFTLAITLAWPLVAMGLIYNICLGFINRAMPQLMVAFVGAPFMVGAGLVLLTVSIGSMLFVWMQNVPNLIGWM